MAVKVNYTALQAQATSILNGFTELDAAIKQANEAADSAIGAVGGEATRVGKAVAASIQAITGSELTNAKTVINDLANSLQTVSNTYEKEDDFLVGKITAIANQAAAGQAHDSSVV